MVEKIAKALLEGFLSWLKLWWEAKRREEAEQRAAALEGKMGSLMTSKTAELRINRPVPKPKLPTAAEWNMGVGR